MISSLMTTEEFKPAISWSDILSETGYCIIPSIVDQATIWRIADDLHRDFEEAPFCSGDFYGERTKRFGRLLLRSGNVHALIQHRRILHIAEDILGPWCDCIQLNLAQAISIYPGALAQLAHRDQDMWRGDIGTREYLINLRHAPMPLALRLGHMHRSPGRTRAGRHCSSGVFKLRRESVPRAMRSYPCGIAKQVKN